MKRFCFGIMLSASFVLSGCTMALNIQESEITEEAPLPIEVEATVSFPPEIQIFINELSDFHQQHQRSRIHASHRQGATFYNFLEQFEGEVPEIIRSQVLNGETPPDSVQVELMEQLEGREDIRFAEVFIVDNYFASLQNWYYQISGSNEAPILNIIEQFDVNFTENGRIGSNASYNNHLFISRRIPMEEATTRELVELLFEPGIVIERRVENEMTYSVYEWIWDMSPGSMTTTITFRDEQAVSIHNSEIEF